MKYLTRQEIYDKVKEHFAEQLAPSIEFSGTSAKCRYRGPEGTKCAIGALIPDSSYYPNIEGRSVGQLSRAILDAARLNIYDGDIYFLRNIQLAHDMAAKKHSDRERFIEQLNKNLKSVAASYDLEPGSPIPVPRTHS